MRLAAEAVEEYARKTDRSVIDAKAECRCRRRRSNGFCIDDEKDGRVQRLCNRSRRADAAPPAVIESHDPLDDGDVRIHAFVRKDLRQTRLGHEPRVQIMSRTPARQLMIAEVDVVRPHLEGLHTKTTRAQG